MKLIEIIKALEKAMVITEGVQRSLSNNEANQIGERGAEANFEYLRTDINAPLRKLLKILLHHPATRQSVTEILDAEAGR